MGLKEADVQGILRITQHLCLTPENLHTGGKVLYCSLIGGRSQNAQATYTWQQKLRFFLCQPHTFYSTFTLHIPVLFSHFWIVLAFCASSFVIRR